MQLPRLPPSGRFTESTQNGAPHVRHGSTRTALVHRDQGSYAKIITHAASEQAGSAPACVSNARAAWKQLFAMGHSDNGVPFFPTVLLPAALVPVVGALGKISGGAYQICHIPYAIHVIYQYTMP